tara:strand:+ start:892 stop:1020 length:129 start_codon:yes stop_codon:yes gene_type:complete
MNSIVIKSFNLLVGKFDLSKNYTGIENKGMSIPEAIIRVLLL